MVRMDPYSNPNPNSFFSLGIIILLVKQIISVMNFHLLHFLYQEIVPFPRIHLLLLQTWGLLFPSDGCFSFFFFLEISVQFMFIIKIILFRWFFFYVFFFL